MLLSAAFAKDSSSNTFQLMLLGQLIINVEGHALQARDVLDGKSDLEKKLTSSVFEIHALCTGVLVSCELLLS